MLSLSPLLSLFWGSGNAPCHTLLTRETHVFRGMVHSTKAFGLLCFVGFLSIQRMIVLLSSVTDHFCSKVVQPALSNPSLSWSRGILK